MMYIICMYVYLCMRYFNTYMFLLSLSLYVYIKAIKLYCISIHICACRCIHTYIPNIALHYIPLHRIPLHTHTHIYIYILYTYHMYTSGFLPGQNHRRFHSSSILPMTHACWRRRALRIWTGSSWRSWTLSNIFVGSVIFRLYLVLWDGGLEVEIRGFREILGSFCVGSAFCYRSRGFCCQERHRCAEGAGVVGQTSKAYQDRWHLGWTLLDLDGLGWDFCGFCDTNSVWKEVAKWLFQSSNPWV